MPPSTSLPLATQQLQQLRAGIALLAQQPTAAETLGTQARHAEALLQALPARYSEVLFNLLDRLESGALFSEESCSFSQKDLTEHLLQWLAKAQAQIDALSAE